jgi:outer membrane protein TolC
VLLLFLVGLGGVRNARAQHVDRAEPVALSLADALARASETAPEVSVAARELRIAEARRIGAGLVMPVNPRLSADVRPPLEHGMGSTPGYGATLDFLFEVGGAPSARVDEAVGYAAVAGAELSRERVSGRLRAFSAYVEAQVAELRVRESLVAKEIAQRVFNAASKRVAVGASSDLEQASAQLDLAQLEASEKGALREREIQLMSLRDALDLDARAALSLTTPIEEPPALAPADVYLRRALANHPELDVVRARVRRLDATRERLERERVPRVGLYTGLDAAPLSPMFGLVGVNVELPFAQRNQGPLAVAARDREAQQNQLELIARRLSRDVLIAVRAYEARRDELATMNNLAIPAAQRSLHLAEEGWLAGRFDLFRLTTAARDAARIRSTRIATLEAAWNELIALERAVGGKLS